jgi:hypothetical protein
MEYTVIPKEYDSVYDSYFDLPKLAEKYGHDKVGFRFEYARDHPVVFAYFLLGIRLRKYQAYALDKILDNQNTMICWGRQLGKSVMLALFVFWATFFNKYPSGFDKSTRVIFISHTEDGAKKIIEEINRFIEIGNMHFYQVSQGKYKGYFQNYIKGINNVFQVSFVRASVTSFVKSFPPTSRIVGNTGSILIIDETARLNLNGIAEDKFFREYAEPTVSANPFAKKIYSSTPEGITGYFYNSFDPFNLYTEHLFHRIWFPYFIHDDKAYTDSIEDKKREYERNGEFMKFQQEYLAMFVSAEGNYFSHDKHLVKIFDPTLHPVTSFDGKCNLGIDFGGQRTSHTVMSISTEKEVIINEKKVKVIYRLWHKRYPLKGDSDLIPDIKKLKLNFPKLTSTIDSLGGNYIIPEIKKLLPTEEMVFRRDKETKYDFFRVMAFRGQIKSYIDEQLQREMYALTNDIKAPNGYTDDNIDSFVMSAYPYLKDDRKFKPLYTWDDDKKIRERN